MSTENVKMERKLYIKNYDRMVEDLLNGIESNKIILDPDYQRNYVWTNEKASLLVESILLNIPIPVIYASEDKNMNWNIVDGLQRLFSLKRFRENEFKLKGLETLPELNGFKFKQLPLTTQQKLLHGELRVVVLQNESDPNIQYDIFMRLNSGAIKLNEQELRNCLFRGKLNNKIKEIAKNNNEIKTIIGNSKVDRMMANELILRYAAVSEKYDRKLEQLVRYDGRIKNMLNSYMKVNQNPSDIFISEFEKKFNMQIYKAFMVFGSNAFKTENSTKINTSLFDCVMISFEDYQLEKLLDKKNDIKKMTNELLKTDNEFINNITRSTNNTEVFNSRLSIYSKHLKEVMKDE